MTHRAFSRLRLTGFAIGRTIIAVAGVVVAVPLLVVLVDGSLGGFATTYRDGLTVAGFVVAAVFAVARPLLWRRERLAWAVLALGIASYTVGQLLWVFWFGDRAEPPFPALSDAFWLAAYPCWITAFAMLTRHRRGALGIRVWLDSAAVGAGVASLVAALALDRIIDGSRGLHGLEFAIQVARPLVDMLLLALVVGALALEGWRFGGGRLLLAGGAAALAVVDTAYLVEHAGGRGHITSAQLGGIALALLAMAAGAWTAPGRRAARDEGIATLLPPMAASGCAIGVLVYGNTTHIHPLAIALATLAGAAALVRTLVGYRMLAELARTRREAFTDELTGLANRRVLFRSLEATLAAKRPAALALLDLDGFKAYNDTHGHLAGDRLLAHLGKAMASAVGSAGAAYRLGGDEFCILMTGHAGVGDVLARIEAAAAAAGDGGEVTVSWGTVLLPDEARDADAAIGLADFRMYTVKGERASSVRRQAFVRRQRP